MAALEKINYADLNSRQKENYNFQKVAGFLADYGFNCLRLSDDWQGADFLACHIDGEKIIKIQLKGRITIDKKYVGKSIHIAFLHNEECYVYPHDEMMHFVDQAGKVNNSSSWRDHRAYSWPAPPKWLLSRIRKYKI